MTAPPRLGKPQAGFAALNRQRLVQYFFFAVFLILFYQVLRMLAPFMVALIGAAILALLVYPMHAAISRRMRQYPSAAAALTATLVTVIIILPTTLFGWIFIKETAKVYPAAKEWVESLRALKGGAWDSRLPPQALALWNGTRDFLDFWNIDLQDILLKNLDLLSSRTTQIATSLIRNTVYVAFNLVLMAFTLFFFLRDGPHIIRRFTELVPMATSHKLVILARIRETLTAVVRGVLAVAVIHGLLNGIGFAMFGVPFPVLLGVLTAFVSPIPAIGAAAVWGPVAACMFISGNTSDALYIFLWCAGVSLADHVLKPLLIGAGSRIPVLLLFLGLLGGLHAYGFMGLLLGPLVIALMLAFVNIYRQEYQWLLQPPQEEKGP